MPHPRIVAHRGWQRDHPENTRAAIAAAVAAGCRAVEFDVRRTRDRRWIVHHDEDLSRMHGSDLVIAEHDLDDIRAVAPVSLLDEVLPLFHCDCLPMIEVKQPETDGIDELCQLVGGPGRPRVVIARGPEMPRELTARLPEVSVFLYTRDWQEALARRDEVAGFDLWHESIALDAAPDAVATLQEGGRQVAVWTVNDLATIDRWLSFDTSWIITDEPWSLQDDEA